MNSPLVSILIPVYNREKLVAAAIESAMRQTYSNIEIVVVDNASTDATWEACGGIARRDNRLRLFRNETNLGPVRNWLRCIEEARGEYAKILWSDDLLAPDYLAKALPLLTGNPDVGFVVSNIMVLDDVSGKVVAGRSRLKNGCYDAAVFIEGSLIGHGFPRSPGCALFRTGDLVKNLLLQIPNRFGSDFSMHAIGNDMLLFLLTANAYPRFAWLDEPLVVFRDHSGSITKGTDQGRLELLYDIAKAHFVEHHISDESLRRRFNSRLAIDLFLYRKNDFGIKKIDDFFSQPERREIDGWYFFKYIASKLRKELF